MSTMCGADLFRVYWSTCHPEEPTGWGRISYWLHPLVYITCNRVATAWTTVCMCVNWALLVHNLLSDKPLTASLCNKLVDKCLLCNQLSSFNSWIFRIPYDIKSMSNILPLERVQYLAVCITSNRGMGCNILVKHLS